MKRCTRCGTEKELTEFYIRKTGKVSQPCRPCYKVVNAEGHARHREKRLEKIRAYNKSHRAEIDAKIKEWRKAHPETVRDYSNRDYRKHHESRLAYHKRRRAEHRDRLNAWMREYQKAHPELMQERARRWRERNPEKARAASRRNSSSSSRTEARRICRDGRSTNRVCAGPGHLRYLLQAGADRRLQC